MPVKKMIAAAISVFFALLIAAGIPARAADTAGYGAPALVSHRGANRLADENTLESYRLAAAYGMDFFECDPRLTKDGALVIMHDGRVDRTTNGTGFVEEMTLEEIKALKTKNGYEVPAFSEVLDLAKELNIGVYIDTKMNTEQYREEIVRLIREKGVAGNVIIGLWWEEYQRWMEENHPDIRTSLSWPAPTPSFRQLKKLGAEWVGILAEQADASIIKQAGDNGLKVITMPLNDMGAIREKIEAGLQVLQTDDPVLLRTVVDIISAANEKSLPYEKLLPAKIHNSPLSQSEMKEIKSDLEKQSGERHRLVAGLAYVTGYCAATNDPPGSDTIARAPWKASLGDGSSLNPTTLAVNLKDGRYSVKYKTMVYIPGIGWSKAEDLCGKCVEEADMRHRIDLWLGMEATAEDENKMTGWRWFYIAEKADE